MVLCAWRLLARVIPGCCLCQVAAQKKKKNLTLRQAHKFTEYRLKELGSRTHRHTVTHTIITQVSAKVQESALLMTMLTSLHLAC